MYGRAINRIRHHYIELAGDQARLFMMTANDDPLGVVRGTWGLTPSRSRPYLTAAYMIAVVNSVIGWKRRRPCDRRDGGSAARDSGGSWRLGSSGPLLYLMYRFEMARFQRLGGFQDVLFPSPEKRPSSQIAARPTFSVG